MRLPRLMLALLLAFAGVAGYCQDDEEQKAEARTQQTGFPIGPKDPWAQFTTSHDGSDSFFFSDEDVNLKERILNVWVRTYRYKYNQMQIDLWTIDRNRHKLKITNTCVYFFNTHKMKTVKQKEMEEWMDIFPTSIPYYLCKCIDTLEKADLNILKYKDWANYEIMPEDKK